MRQIVVTEADDNALLRHPERASRPPCPFICTEGMPAVGEEVEVAIDRRPLYTSPDVAGRAVVVAVSELGIIVDQYHLYGRSW